MSVLTITLHPAIDKVLSVAQLHPNEVARCKVEMVHGGGKGNNVARALTRLNVPVVATGYQGGYSGTFITEHLESEGIATSYVECAQPTRTSTVLQVDDTGDTYPLYEPGQAVSADEIEALKRHIQTLLPETSLILLCGSGQTELLAPVYADIISMARESQVPSILDSSGEALRHAIDARPNAVKVNRNELGGYLDRPLESSEVQIEAMVDLQERGIEIVALSRGEKGLIATDGDEIWEGSLQVERIINVVGCGDSQLAGFAKQYLEAAPIKEMVRWGVACGTANTQVRGAGRIEQKTVDEMLPKVLMDEIKR